MGIKKRLHRQAVIAGTEAPVRHKTKLLKWFRCSKCKHIIPESGAISHKCEK